MKKLAIIALVLAGSLQAADLVKTGQKLYKRNGCATCHNDDGMGRAKDGKLGKQEGPRIAGLAAVYSEAQILDIKAEKRTSEFTKDMVLKIKSLNEEKIKALAAYLESMGESFKGMKE